MKHQAWHFFYIPFLSALSTRKYSPPHACNLPPPPRRTYAKWKMLALTVNNFSTETYNGCVYFLLCTWWPYRAHMPAASLHFYFMFAYIVAFVHCEHLIWILQHRSAVLDIIMHYIIMEEIYFIKLEYAVIEKVSRRVEIFKQWNSKYEVRKFVIFNPVHVQQISTACQPKCVHQQRALSHAI